MRIILMARRPRPGRTKTRLAQTLGTRAAAEFAAASCGDIAERIERLENVGHWVAWAGARSEEDLAVDLGPGWREVAQGEGDLGERMARLWRGAEGPAIFVGTDAPTLPLASVHRAARCLAAGAPAVFQPALDGGYTLCGFAEPPESWFAGVPWSTADVMEHTLAAAERDGREPCLIEPWYDVDDEGGLRVLRAHLPLLRDADGWAPRVAHILETGVG